MTAHPAPSKYLSIYVNDQLALLTVAVELARRSAASNAGTGLGTYLSALVLELEDERAALRQLMEELGVGTDPVKQGLAWLGEKAGRLKLNGHLRGQSPLSPLTELDGLVATSRATLGLWRALAEPGAGGVVPPARLEELIARAEARAEELERRRLPVAAHALTA